MSTPLHAMPILVCVLCIFAIAYRYYSAFLAARVAVLDDSRPTPAMRHPDGQNYHPTSKWVLFGHHFAAISGAGPLVGPVLAAQFGYMPGLLWIVIGVCLAGAVQDFLVLAASIRRDGQSLAQIAFDELGKFAGWAGMLAIVAIIIVALAGLGKVVVAALGGDMVKLPANCELVFRPGTHTPVFDASHNAEIPAGAIMRWYAHGSPQNNYVGSEELPVSEMFTLHSPKGFSGITVESTQPNPDHAPGAVLEIDQQRAGVPADATRRIPGSPWGIFTIAATIPIALFVGLYMYRVRRGRTLEASLIGGALTLAATFAGGYVATHAIGKYFDWSGTGVIWAMAIYGFVASVLPVWLLLTPRDYLSSMLKIGTIALLVVGVLVADPVLKAPVYNHLFASGGGPILAGKIFPFLFITIMCGAISGFHALVASGTTPKMIMRESDARTIGYGAMLMEGLVGVIAMIAAASLPPGDYYAMNMPMDQAPAYQRQLAQLGAADVEHLPVYEADTQETLRGRPGGAVTLAVGMSYIFDSALKKFALTAGALWKYWYHFAIMFEALFILTTIDAGTRIGRFLLQEILGKLHAPLGRRDWWVSSFVTTGLIVAGWAYLITYNNFMTIWGMFGVANQMLAVIALAIISVSLVNSGRTRYVWVTALPMAFVLMTTTSAAALLLQKNYVTMMTQLARPSGTRATAILTNSIIQGSLLVMLLVCTGIILIAGIVRCGRTLNADRSRGFEVVSAVGV